jgi:hypothetical protein
MEKRSRDFQGRKAGQYVRIQMEGNGILSLAEVKVFGQKLGELSVKDFETAERYNVTVYRNTDPYGSEPDEIERSRINQISEGYDFNRTVNKTDESFWKIGSEIATSIDIFGQGVDVTVTAEGGQNSTSSVTDSQGGNVAQSTTDEVRTRVKVPGGCVRYEFHKWIFQQTPIEYILNGKKFSWYKNQSTPKYVNDVTVFVFPITEVPAIFETIISPDGWVEKADFDTFYEDYKRSTYRVDYQD